MAIILLKELADFLDVQPVCLGISNKFESEFSLVLTVWLSDSRSWFLLNK